MRCSVLLLPAAVLLGQAPEGQPVVLDRIAVTVDKQVIAESDVIRFLRVAAFLDDKPLDLSPAARRHRGADLVDQTLMNMEASDSHIDAASPAGCPAAARIR